LTDGLAGLLQLEATVHAGFQMGLDGGGNGGGQFSEGIQFQLISLHVHSLVSGSRFSTVAFQMNYRIITRNSLVVCNVFPVK
jgi:hypothetical protein